MGFDVDGVMSTGSRLALQQICDRKTWARILTITGGSSMAAMIFKLPMGPALAVAVRLSQFVFSFRHR